MKVTNCFYIVLLVLLTSPANADNLATSLSNCSKVEQDLERLSCFDLLSAQYKTQAATNAPKGPTKNMVKDSISKALAAKPVPSEVLEFGASHIKNNDNDAEEIEFIVLTASKVEKDAFDKLVLSFENGQIWQQKDSRYFRMKKGEEVKLSKGALGAIYLKKNDESSNRSIRVRRLK
jgi:hypothetical protein